MNSKLKITFVMPRTGEWASGGFRIIYQYANHLSRRGHAVTVVHPGRYVINPTLLDHLKNFVRYLLRKADGNYRPDSWLKMDPNVSLTCVPFITERFIPDGDIVIATAWQTAELVSQYSQRKGRRFYLIQHLETWNGPAERVYATWKMPLQKMVPSKWLAQIALDMEEPVAYFPYGLDIDAFQMVVSREERDPKQLMMLYHRAEWKGCEEGIKAISLAREKDPGISAILFGVPPRPDWLPPWMEYHQSPVPELLQSLYNRAAIFVAPSRTEGWGLTGCEAMLCGAALVATDIDGHREFAFDGKTALLSPARAPQELSENILRLIASPELRMQLAKNGYDFVRQLTWERATTAFEGILCGLDPAYPEARK